MNVLEMKKNLARAIETNMNLQAEGISPIAYCVSGAPGLGKTEAVEQLVSHMGGKCITLSLSQLDQIGDLVGFPLKEYEVKDNDGNLKWVTEREVPKYTSTGKNRMGYAQPEWICGIKDNGKPNVLFLDDFSR